MADWGNRREIKTASGSGSKFMALDLSDYEVEQFKIKVGNNRIEILPYKISSNLHPLVVAGKRKKGELDYNVAVKVHTNVGPGKKTVVCPYPYGKPCPICEAAIAAKNAGDKKTNEALYAKQKIYYNIVDNAEREKGVQILEANAKYFQKPLETVDLNSEEDFPGRFFADIDTGLTVKILGAKEEFTGNDGKKGEFTQYSSISFVERKESVEEFADKVIPLDTCIKLKTYEELEALMMGAGGDDEPEEDEAPAKKVAKPKVEEDEEEEEAPKPKAKKPPVDKDDEPAPKPKAVDECPEGHEFGDAFNADHAECNDCNPKLYAKCAKYGRTLGK
jgi:hypothetical protein